MSRMNKEDATTNQLPRPSDNEVADMAQLAEEEGTDRMENDGAGVVPQNLPKSELVMRNDLPLDSKSDG